MCHYGSRICEFSDDDIRNVSVIRIDVESMTGKNTIEEKIHFLRSVMIAFHKPNNFIADFLCFFYGFAVR
jgi:hypothetical protein